MTEEKTEVYIFRLSITEKKKIKTLAEKSNLSASEYIRACSLKGMKVTKTTTTSYQYE